MNLSKRNLIGRFYRWMYGEYPADVCTFFWVMLYTLIFSPIVVPGRLLTQLDPDMRDGRYAEYKKYEKGGHLGLGIGFLAVCLLCMFVGVGVINILGYQFTNWFGLIFLGIPLGAITIVFLIVGIALTAELIRMYKEYRRKKRHEAIYAGTYKYKEPWTQKVADVFAAIRGKYCVKLTWYDTDTSTQAVSSEE